MTRPILWLLFVLAPCGARADQGLAAVLDRIDRRAAVVVTGSQVCFHLLSDDGKMHVACFHVDRTAPPAAAPTLPRPQ